MEWKGDGWRCTVAYRVDRGCLLIICYASRRVTRDCYRQRSRLGTEMDTEERRNGSRSGASTLRSLALRGFKLGYRSEETRFPGSIVGGRSWMESWLVGQIGISLVNASVCVLN